MVKQLVAAFRQLQLVCSKFVVGRGSTLYPYRELCDAPSLPSLWGGSTFSSFLAPSRPSEYRSQRTRSLSQKFLATAPRDGDVYTVPQNMRRFAVETSLIDISVNLHIGPILGLLVNKILYV